LVLKSTIFYNNVKEYIYVTQWDLTVITQKRNVFLLQNPFIVGYMYAILNNIRSRLLHVSADKHVTSLQAVPC